MSRGGGRVEVALTAELGTLPGGDPGLATGTPRIDTSAGASRGQRRVGTARGFGERRGSRGFEFTRHGGIALVVQEVVDAGRGSPKAPPDGQPSPPPPVIPRRVALPRCPLPFRRTRRGYSSNGIPVKESRRLSRQPAQAGHGTKTWLRILTKTRPKTVLTKGYAIALARFRETGPQQRLNGPRRC